MSPEKKQKEDSFTRVSICRCYLQLLPTPRTLELSIFVATTTADTTDYFTVYPCCACARGIIKCYMHVATLSEKRTTSVQRTNPMPPIALPIEIVHLEPPRSRHLSTPDNGQPAYPQTIAACKKTSKSGRRSKPQAKIVRI